MATATLLSALVVPQVFTPYVNLATETKSKLIQSGAIARSSFLDDFLVGGGNVVTMPFNKDLLRSNSNVSSDDDAVTSTATPFTAGSINQHRLSRNKSWTSTDLAGDITGSDPLQNIVGRVSDYWAWDLQSHVIATLQGVFADNAAAPTGSEHVANDMTVDVKGASFTLGTTNFTTEALIDTIATMGDSGQNLSTLLVHSVVYYRMLKNDLIDFLPDSEGKLTIPTFMGLRVVFDDMVTRSAGVFDSYVLGSGAIQLGMGSPKTPTEVFRDPSKGNGGGVETLYSRTEWIIAPTGTSYVGTATVGGASVSTLANAASWMRGYPERKQIPIARLVTREY
jgi:hypothetical protein